MAGDAVRSRCTISSLLHSELIAGLGTVDSVRGLLQLNEEQRAKVVEALQVRCFRVSPSEAYCE